MRWTTVTTVHTGAAYQGGCLLFQSKPGCEVCMHLLMIRNQEYHGPNHLSDFRIIPPELCQKRLSLLVHGLFDSGEGTSQCSSGITSPTKLDFPLKCHSVLRWGFEGTWLHPRLRIKCLLFISYHRADVFSIYVFDFAHSLGNSILMGVSELNQGRQAVLFSLPCSYDRSMKDGYEKSGNLNWQCESYKELNHVISTIRKSIS